MGNICAKNMHDQEGPSGYSVSDQAYFANKKNPAFDKSQAIAGFQMNSQ